MKNKKIGIYYIKSKIKNVKIEVNTTFYCFSADKLEY